MWGSEKSPFQGGVWCMEPFEPLGYWGGPFPPQSRGVYKDSKVLQEYCCCVLHGLLTLWVITQAMWRCMGVSYGGEEAASLDPQY